VLFRSAQHHLHSIGMIQIITAQVICPIPRYVQIDQLIAGPAAKTFNYRRRIAQQLVATKAFALYNESVAKKHTGYESSLEHTTLTRLTAGITHQSFVLYGG